MRRLLLCSIAAFQACAGAPPPAPAAAPPASAPVAATNAPAQPRAPATEQRPVSDAYDGVTVVDPYRWLESYPGTLLLTGDNDPRVGPMQSRKMGARLQAASSGSAPILYTTNAAGHGNNSSLDDRIADKVDSYGFMLKQLGVSYRPPAK